MSLFRFFRIFTALEIFLRALDDDEVAFLAARNCFRTFAFTENWSLFELYLNFFSLVSATTSFSSILSSFLLRDLSSFEPSFVGVGVREFPFLRGNLSSPEELPLSELEERTEPEEDGEDDDIAMSPHDNTL